MGMWQFTSEPDDDGKVTMLVTLTSDDATGALSGTAKFRDVPYSVTGQWAAAGSVPGRNDSVFWFGGANADVSAFLVGAGDLIFSTTPATMQIAVTTASAGDGRDYGYNGKLTRIDDPDEPGGPLGPDE